MRDLPDHPTLFPLPPPEAGRDAPRRAAVKPQAPTSFIRPGSRMERRNLRRLLLDELKKKVSERWKAFSEWTGFEKREIDVELIPGRKCRVAIPQGKPPRLILFRLLPDKTRGGWFTRPVTLWGNLARFDASLCEDLGLPIGRTTLWRLIYGGFVKAYRIAPMTTLVDLDSLLAHMAACQIDGEKPSFWTQSRVTTYREWEKITPAMLERLEAAGKGSEPEDEEGGADE